VVAAHLLGGGFSALVHRTAAILGARVRLDLVDRRLRRLELFTLVDDCPRFLQPLAELPRPRILDRRRRCRSPPHPAVDGDRRVKGASTGPPEPAPEEPVAAAAPAS